MEKNLLNDQDLQPPRGMRDFYPDEFRKREKIFNAWRSTAKHFGFDEFDTPVVESLDLLKRKSGEEIVDQIYNFTDKSGRELALRPELTPSLVRMVLGKINALSKPIKWSSIPQCFRYERMTVGRKREHYQWNLDIMGESGQIAEAELVAAAVYALKELGLDSDKIVIKVGSRQIINDLLEKFGFNSETFQDIYLLLDKRGKVGFEDIGAMLIEKGFNTDQVSLIFEILNIKDLDEVKKQLSAESIGVRQMESFLNYVESFGIGDFIKFDISVVRGLSYYTGIVFECFDKESKFRAIFGGGRYDNLFSNLGGINLPAVGFGFGDVVISEVLEHFGLGETPPKDLDYVVCYTSEELENKAIEVSNKLREKGNVLLLYGPERLKKALQTAVKMGARNIAILDPRECSEGKYLIKDLSTEKQEEIDL